MPALINYCTNYFMPVFTNPLIRNSCWTVGGRAGPTASRPPAPRSLITHLAPPRPLTARNAMSITYWTMGWSISWSSNLQIPQHLMSLSRSPKCFAWTNNLRQRFHNTVFVLEACVGYLGKHEPHHFTNIGFNLTALPKWGSRYYAGRLGCDCLC